MTRTRAARAMIKLMVEMEMTRSSAARGIMF